MVAQPTTRTHALAFLSTPFSEDYRRIGHRLRDELLKYDIDTVNIENIRFGDNIVPSMLDLMVRSDFVIFDITDQNPNVMFELGFAQASRIPTIPIVQIRNGESTEPFIPSSLSGMLFFIYDQSNIDELAKNIRNWFFHRQSVRTLAQEHQSTTA